MYMFGFRYKMPLLHIVGVTPTNQTVSLSFCFLSEESEPNYTWALSRFRDCYSAMIAERKVVGGVYVLEDMSYTMRIRFSGVDDMGLRFSNLIVTFASSAPRDYTDKYPLDPTRNEEALWTAKNRMHTLAETVIALRRLVRRTDRTEHDPWRELFWDFGIFFPEG